MRAKIEIRPATFDDIAAIVPHLRAADIRECRAQMLIEPADGLAYAMKRATRAWVGFVNGEIACLFGVMPTTAVTQEWGVPFLVATPVLEKNGRYVVKYAKQYLAKMLELHPKLENHVDARNATAINWLGWLGFTLDDAAPAGPLGRMFHHFRMEA